MEEGRLPTDDELMERTSGGDLRAFEDLVRRHRSAAWRLACGFLGEARDAQDIVQEAFLRILEAAPRYRPSGAFPAYLRRVLANLCMDRARKMEPVYTDAVPEPDDPRPSEEEAMIASERGRRVQLALEALPSNQRMVVLLKYYEGLSYAEIAAALGTTEKAVERHLARARECLCSALADL